LAGAAAKAAVGLGEIEGELGFLGMVCALIGMQRARFVTQRMAARLILFLIIFWVFVG
jgi:hypothetical protein